ncbi:MAG: NADP-specific glutamate dehydrogenase [Alcanivoracaceae bacterium]|jgi:glutamate dehydrogenase (NADP+)|nr:NADP-specific glutamate dehydrogenase [Alcanivoracaceae bacterium]
MQSLDSFMEQVCRRDPDQPMFQQAVREVMHSLWPFLEQNPGYADKALLERLVEPERVITFRVPWIDDANQVQVNRGIRVQMNSAIGPYKGGLRFHPAASLDVLKFMAFEQTIKNSLTTLPMGGGKGGADFDPHGKSEGEIMRFCQAFMMELQKYIRSSWDIPAGDIGVNDREIGYLFGTYKKLAGEFSAALTGKAASYGGSLIRPQATGYGLVYFVEEILNTAGRDLEGQKVLVSGAGTVALYAAYKAIHSGAKVITVSDSGGVLVFRDGMSREQWQDVYDLKMEKRGRLSELADMKGAAYHENKQPWYLHADVALPCAIQNELDDKAARKLVDNGCRLVAEGANMPCTAEAIKVFRDANIGFAPGKAANAGGVAVSGLEITQNALRTSWTEQEVDARLHDIMQKIHHACVRYGARDSNGNIDYINGANIAGFVKVADAMLAQGVV